MIGNLGPYSGMKDSGNEWLGEVPEHWEIRTLSQVDSCQKAEVEVRRMNFRQAFRVSDMATYTLRTTTSYTRVGRACRWNAPVNIQPSGSAMCYLRAPARP